MILLILAAATAADPAPVAPPAPVLPPPPVLFASASRPVLSPFMQTMFRTLPEDGRFTLDFTVQEDGRVSTCFIRALSGRMAKIGAIPARCPATYYEPYRDGAGMAVRKNVSVITAIAVTDAP